jgi:hypothetical protein
MSKIAGKIPNPDIDAPHGLERKMRLSVFLVLVLMSPAVSFPAMADDLPKIFGALKTTSEADSLHVDYDFLVNAQVDSLALDLWEPARIFDAGNPGAAVVAETLRVSSPLLPGDSGLFTYRLRGRQSWARKGRSEPSRIWAEYWGGEDPDPERDSRKKFWEVREFSLGLTVQPLVIIGSSYTYYDPGVDGVDQQASYLESQYIGVHANFVRWRLTLAEVGSSGQFFGEPDSTEQHFDFMTGVAPALRYDFGDLTGFRPVASVGWHRFDVQMQGPAAEGAVPLLDRKEEGLGLTMGVADPAGTLTYSFLDLEHYRHLVSLSVPVMGFKRSTFGTRIDYVQVDGRSALKTHFVFDFSTPLFPKDGPLVTPEAAQWTWRNYAALAVAGVAEPLVAVGVVVYLGVKGVGALF